MSSNTPRKKVLFFLPSTTGGAERMTITIAKMLPRDKYEVIFIIVSQTLGTIVDFVPAEYKVIHIKIRNIWCGATAKIVHAIKEEKANIVFGSLLYLNARLIVAAKLCGVKVIVRNNIDLYNARPSNRILAKITYRWADAVIAQQEEMRGEILSVLKLREEKVIVLHNPIDTQLIDKKVKEPSPYSPTLKDNTKYVWAARFSEEKCQDLLIRAFQLVTEKDTSAHLFLIGKCDFSIPYCKALRNLATELNLTDRVHFVGFETNPYKWIRHADVYVMPSRKEGLPNSLVEAMYLGKPIVATRCIPVIDRIVADKYNGYLVQPDDAVGLAEAMLKAPKLKDYKMTYHPAEKEDFIKLFNEI